MILTSTVLNSYCRGKQISASMTSTALSHIQILELAPALAKAPNTFSHHDCNVSFPSYQKENVLIGSRAKLKQVFPVDHHSRLFFDSPQILLIMLAIKKKKYIYIYIYKFERATM